MIKKNPIESFNLQCVAPAPALLVSTCAQLEWGSPLQLVRVQDEVEHEGEDFDTVSSSLGRHLLGGQTKFWLFSSKLIIKSSFG